MTTQLMAFGDRNNAMWINAPMKGLVIGLKGNVVQRPLSNGQMSLVRSVGTRKHFDFVYKGTAAALDPIEDFIEGQYGPGPWMFNFPDALNGNLLPRTWSQPSLAVGARGNQALDFYSTAFAFGAPLSATLTNPNIQSLAITGLTGSPLKGAVLWSPSSTAPVVPASYLTRPYCSLLIPPNYAPRITAWGLPNNANSPGLYYSLSTIPAATVAAGTKIAPALAGTSVTPATSASWRVLDLWIGAGAAVTATEYTNFGAIDVRMALTTAPAQPTSFDFGRGQFPCQFGEDNIPVTYGRVGADDTKTFYEVDGSMDEVTSPW